MRDFTHDIREVQRRLAEAKVYLSVVENRERFAVLEHEVAEPGLWDDPDRAKKLNAEYANIKDDLEAFDTLTEEIENVEVLHELARDEDDASVNHAPARAALPQPRESEAPKPSSMDYL